MGGALLRLAVPALLASLALLASATAAHAAELLTWSAERQPLNRALTTLAQLTGDAPALAYDTAIGAASTAPVTLSLRAADPATVRQALAHAAGLWWATDVTGGTVLTGDARPPRGPLHARTHSSGLRNQPALEPLVRALTGPWLGLSPGTSARATPDVSADAATLDYLPDTGLWQATLDDQGQAQLIQVLGLLQQPLPGVPPLLPDPQTPEPSRRLVGAVRVMPWGDWCAALAEATGNSVSLAPEVSTRPAPAIAALTIADLPTALASAGLRGVCLHGVWCISAVSVPDEREHPAQRRRLGVVPLPHLAADDAAGRKLAAALRERVIPSAWTQPGWSMSWLTTIPGLPAAHGLLIAGDAPAIHAVLDACDVLDRLGVEAGLEALAR